MIDYPDPEAWGHVRLPSENEQNLAYYLQQEITAWFNIEVPIETIEKWIHDFYESIP